MNKQEKIDLMNTVPYWWHYIDLGEGIVTPGRQGGLGQKGDNATKRKLKRLPLPENLEGKTVIDVGCSDGFFSFECKKRGAKRVVAVDNPQVNKSKAFVVARQILDLDIEYIHSDIYNLDIDKLGKFDIVLGLGLLYHLKSPLIGLEILKKLTKQCVIIESHFIKGEESLMKYNANVDENGNVRKNNHSTWFPTLKALKEMMKDVGFINIEVLNTSGDRVVLKGE